MNSIKRYTQYMSTVLLISLHSIAHAQTLQGEMSDWQRQQHHEETKDLIQPTETVDTPVIKKQPTDSSKITLDKKHFEQNPSLVLRAFIPALIQAHVDNVMFLYPIYEQLPKKYQDETITIWAKAIIAKKNKQYAKAVQHYRFLLNENSQNLAIRTQLAVTLFENQQYDAAQDQFYKLRASESVSKNDILVINSYLKAIKKKYAWSYGVGLTYVADKNINNVSAKKKHGNFSLGDTQSGHGARFSGSLAKGVNIKGGLSSKLQSSLGGVYYWDNHKYNDLYFRTAAGISYENATQKITLLPFYGQTYTVANQDNSNLEKYSYTQGASLDASQWVSKNWQLHGSYEYGQQYYKTRQHLDGFYHNTDVKVNFLPSLSQLWSLSVGYNDTNTQEKDDSYALKSIQLGWQQEWPKGFSTNISLRKSYKNAKGKKIIFNKKQVTEQISTNITVWHKAIHYFGVTPRLMYSHHDVKSNIDVFDYDKNQVYIQFSRAF